MSSTAKHVTQAARTLVALAAAAAALACLPVTTQAAETISSKISFVPYKLGAGTTIETEADIGTTNGEVPSPAVRLELQFPKSLNLTSSNLGLAICNPTALFNEGQAGCPDEARMGFGSTEMAVPFGPEIVTEAATVNVYMGPPEGNATSLLLFGEGRSPVYAQLLMQGLLLDGTGAFNELALKTTIPLVATLPGARDVAVTHMHLSLGPRGLTYYRHVRGKLVGYRPRGMVLPTKCPAGGFPFDSTIYFQDGSVVKQALNVPCRDAQKHRA